MKSLVTACPIRSGLCECGELPKRTTSPWRFSLYDDVSDAEAFVLFQNNVGVQRMLRLPAPPRPSHIADALALALTGLSRRGGRLA